MRLDYEPSYERSGPRQTTLDQLSGELRFFAPLIAPQGVVRMEGYALCRGVVHTLKTPSPAF